MKKIIGILGVAVIAATMFYSANAVNVSKTDLNLASLVSMNTANAEVEGSGVTCSTYCSYRFYKTCSYTKVGSDWQTMTITCHDMIKV